MKSIFAGIGFLIVAWIVVCALGHGNGRQGFGNWFGDSNPIGYGADQGCESDGCAPTPVPYRSTAFEYEQRSVSPAYGRVWVQPQYRTVYQGGYRQTVVVRPGYWRTAAAPVYREKRPGFDFGALLTSFQR